MTSFTLGNFATDLIRQSGKSLHLVVNSKNTTRMAAYHPEKHQISLNPLKCEQEYQELTQNNYHFRSYQEFIHMLMAHEIGHALDPELSFLSKQEEKLIDSLKYCGSEEEMDNTLVSLGELIITVENNAWTYAEPLLPRSLKRKTVDKYRMFALESYIGGLEGMKQQLMAYLA